MPEQGLRLLAALSVKGIRVDTPIPIADLQRYENGCVYPNSFHATYHIRYYNRRIEHMEASYEATIYDCNKIISSQKVR